MVDNRYKLGEKNPKTCAKNVHFFFLICHPCFDVYSGGNDPLMDLNICSHWGQCLAHSKYSVNATERMSKCPRVNEWQKKGIWQTGRAWRRSHPMSYTPSPQLPIKRGTFGLEKCYFLDHSHIKRLLIQLDRFVP